MRLPDPKTQTPLEHRDTLDRISTYLNSLAIIKENDAELWRPLSNALHSILNAYFILKGRPGQ